MSNKKLDGTLNRPERSRNPDFIKYESIVSPVTLLDLKSIIKRPVSVFEKIDGGNSQVRRVGSQLYPGSRANFLKGPIIERRPWFKKFVAWVYSNGSLYNLPEDVVMFGEWSGNHTLNYRPEFTDSFFVIDVLDIPSRKFIPYSDGRSLLEKAGIEGVEFLRDLVKGRRISDNLIEELLNKPSDYRLGPKEGIVIKDYTLDNQRFAKIYCPDFAEKRKLPNGVIDYLTPARFKKSALRILDEGHDVSYERLVNDVQKDIMKEEGKTYSYDTISRRLDIYYKDKEVDFSSYLKR